MNTNEDANALGIPKNLSDLINYIESCIQKGLPESILQESILKLEQSLSQLQQLKEYNMTATGYATNILTIFCHQLSSENLTRLEDKRALNDILAKINNFAQELVVVNGLEWAKRIERLQVLDIAANQIEILKTWDEITKKIEKNLIFIHIVDFSMSMLSGGLLQLIITGRLFSNLNITTITIVLSTIALGFVIPVVIVNILFAIFMIGLGLAIYGFKRRLIAELNSKAESVGGWVKDIDLSQSKRFIQDGVTKLRTLGIEINDIDNIGGISDQLSEEYKNILGKINPNT